MCTPTLWAICLQQAARHTYLTQDVPTEQVDEGQGPTREGQQPLSFWSFQKPKDPALRSPSMSLGGHLQKGKCLAQQGSSQHSWRS